MNTLGSGMLALLLAGGTSALAATTTVTQSVEPQALGTEDTAQVTVEVTGANGGVEVSLPSSSDFEVLGRSSSTSTSIQEDGSGPPVVQRSQRFVFSVHPLHEGAVRIPAASVSIGGTTLAGASSTLEVSAGHVAASTQAPAGDPFGSLFDEDPFGQMPSVGSLFDRFFGRRAVAPRDIDARLFVSVDKPAVYAGEQATVSVYLATRNNLSSVGALRLPTIDGAASQDIASGTRMTPRPMTLDGREYQTFLVARRAIFPSKPGALRIPAASIEVSVGGPFELPSSRTLQSLPVALEVKALPQGGRPGEPVGDWHVTMAVTSPGRPQVGQPLPVQVRIEGSGDLQALPEPALELKVGQARVLAPTVRDTPTTRRGVLGGTRAFEFLLTPDAAGPLELAPVHLAYFNPATARHEQSSSEGLSLDVTPSASSTTVAARTDPAPPHPPAASVTAPPLAFGAADLSRLPGWVLPGAVAVVLALGAVAALVGLGRWLRRLTGDRGSRPPSRRAHRRAAAHALAGARVAAKSAREGEAIHSAERALIEIASAVGLAPDTVDVDRLANDVTRPSLAAWAQALLLCRRARFLTLDRELVSDILERTARSLEELPRNAPLLGGAASTPVPHPG